MKLTVQWVGDGAGAGCGYYAINLGSKRLLWAAEYGDDPKLRDLLESLCQAWNEKR